MLIKIILALVIVVMFLGGIGAAGSITGLKTAIADKQLTTSSALLDKAIVNWYTTHDYELPASLSQEMLNIMGLHDIDLSKFTYTKLADNKFRLVAALSGKSENSINSDKELPLKASTPPLISSSSGSGSSSGDTPADNDTSDDGNTNENNDTGDNNNTGGSSSDGNGEDSAGDNTTGAQDCNANPRYFFQKL